MGSTSPRKLLWAYTGGMLGWIAALTPLYACFCLVLPLGWQSIHAMRHRPSHCHAQQHSSSEGKALHDICRLPFWFISPPCLLHYSCQLAKSCKGRGCSKSLDSANHVIRLLSYKCPTRIHVCLTWKLLVRFMCFVPNLCIIHTSCCIQYA